MCVRIKHQICRTFSLNVNVGSSSDPDDTLGLAHLLEHMLFMGSKKYPDENYYDEFIENNGEYANAFTTLHDTCFYYSIGTNFLIESLDIFSQFFIDPLLNTQIRLIVKCRRIQSVIKKIINPLYYGSRFTSGNLKTLKRDDIYAQLCNFHRDKYSSNLMTLTIIDKRPIEEIKNIVSLYFSPIYFRMQLSISYLYSIFNLIIFLNNFTLYSNYILFVFTKYI